MDQHLRRYQLETPGSTRYLLPQSLFVSANVREGVNSNRGGGLPVFLSEIPELFDQGILPLDVAIEQVSPTDAHRDCTLGTSVHAAFSAVRNARIVIAQVNPRMPRVLCCRTDR